MRRHSGSRWLVLSAIALFCAASAASADNILLTQYDYNDNNVYAVMEANLEAAGHTVDIVNARIGGNIASYLGATTYDQVFLWDLTASAYISAADLTALDAFWTTHPSLVVDTRSYGYYYQGTNASEVTLLQNVASAFSARGGGVWVGTDHDPSWTRNSNQFLSQIGVDTVIGLHAEPVNVSDPASILLAGVVTTDLWAGGASVGEAPLGIQPNGIDMRFHFGHSSPFSGAINYISASFGTFIAPDEDPDDHKPIVPEPGTMLLVGVGLVALVVRRRKSAA